MCPPDQVRAGVAMATSWKGKSWSSTRRSSNQRRLSNRDSVHVMCVCCSLSSLGWYALSNLVEFCLGGYTHFSSESITPSCLSQKRLRRLLFFRFLCITVECTQSPYHFLYILVTSPLYLRQKGVDERSR